jgi:hypothetical protein
VAQVAVYTTHKYKVGRAYNCWMLNLLMHRVTRRLIKGRGIFRLRITQRRMVSANVRCLDARTHALTHERYNQALVNTWRYRFVVYISISVFSFPHSAVYFFLHYFSPSSSFLSRTCRWNVSCQVCMWPENFRAACHNVSTTENFQKFLFIRKHTHTHTLVIPAEPDLRKV